MNNKNNLLMAYIGLSLMTLIIGMSFIFVKLGLAITNSYDLLAHRFSAALLSIIVLVIFKLIKIPRIHYRQWLSIVFISLLYPIAFFAFQALGMQNSGAAQAGITFALTPVVTLIASSIFLKEQTTWLQKFGVILSILGLVYIFSQQQSIGTKNLASTGLLLLSVFSMSGYFILGKNLIKRYNSSDLTVAMIIVGFVIFNAISLIQHGLNHDFNSFFSPLKDLNFILIVLYLGVLSSVLTAFFSNYALYYISAAKISIFSNLNPIIAMLGGALFLNETLHNFEITGFIVVIIGVIIVLVFKPKNQ